MIYTSTQAPLNILRYMRPDEGAQPQLKSGNKQLDCIRHWTGNHTGPGLRKDAT